MFSPYDILRGKIAAILRRKQSIRDAILREFEVTGRHDDKLRRRHVMASVVRQCPELRLEEWVGRDCSEVRGLVIAMGVRSVADGNARFYRGIRPKNGVAL